MDFLNKITQEEVDRIESYLRQLLSDAERAEFENELAVNPKLKQQTQAIKTMMDEMEEAVFRSKIKDFHAQMPSTGKVRTLYTKWIWPVIAAAAVFAFLFLWNSKSAYENIYDKYFYPDPRANASFFQ